MRQVSGDLTLSWVRRSRIDGDSWSSVDVPLAESRETYLLRVVQAGAVLRETSVAQPFWTYADAQQVADAVAAPFEIHIAQMSDVFGAGPFARITINV